MLVRRVCRFCTPCSSLGEGVKCLLQDRVSMFLIKQAGNLRQEDHQMGPLRRASGFKEFAGKSVIATGFIRKMCVQETEVWESCH